MNNDGYTHISVMFEECIRYLEIKKNGFYVDCTAGGGGHSAGIMKKLGQDGYLLSIDRDEEAIKATKKKLDETVGYVENPAEYSIEKANYRNLDKLISKINENRTQILLPDGILADLGVSSRQFDEGERGFSYRTEAHLDMRMDRNEALDAAMVVNTYTHQRLTEIIREYGEEKWATRITEFIINRRKEKPIETTTELMEIIKAAIPAFARREGPHPARRTFQALRIYVNDELGALREFVDKAIDLLKPGGRICIITFHSLEDRIVKEAFRKAEKPCTCPSDFPVCTCGKKPKLKIISKKPVLPSSTEITENKRSSSAKLRVAEKL